MRNITSVTNVIDIVRGSVRDVVVAVKRNAKMWADSLRSMSQSLAHLEMRHELAALAGSSLFKKPRLQPAYAAAYAAYQATSATARTGRCERGVGPDSHPSIRIG